MNNIIISAIGSDRPGIVFELTEIIKKHGANIEESKMTRLGSDFVMIMLISIEDKLIKSLILDLESIKELVVTAKDTQSNNIQDGEHCLIELNGADNEGIVNVLSNYLSNKSMNIQNLNTINMLDGYLIGGASQNAKKLIDIVKKSYN